MGERVWGEQKTGAAPHPPLSLPYTLSPFVSIPFKKGKEGKGSFVYCHRGPKKLPSPFLVKKGGNPFFAHIWKKHFFHRRFSSLAALSSEEEESSHGLSPGRERE